MIVKMKEVTILLSARQRRQALDELRELGVLHVKEGVPALTEDIHQLDRELAQVDRVLQLLKSDTRESVGDVLLGARVVREVLEKTAERDRLQSRLDELVQIRAWFERWGRVSGRSLAALEESGFPVRFYVSDKHTVSHLPGEIPYIVIREDHGIVHFLVIGDSPSPECRQDPMPAVEIAELEREIAAIGKELQRIDSEIGKQARRVPEVNRYRHELVKRLEYQTVYHGMGQTEELAYIEGFCPVESLQALRTTAERSGWGLWLQDPQDPSSVPTLIRNPRFVRIVEPLFKFMGTLPGYHEIDVSFVFLSFFSLFYAIIIGDAGYGLVFLIATILASRKFKKLPREPFRLFTLLSVATIIWGLCSGNWFGAASLGRLPVLRNFIVPGMDSSSEESQNFMMRLSFIIGVVHLSVAHLIAAVQKFNSPRALADLGWISILWFVYFLAGQLVLGNTMPGFAPILLIAGAGLVILFANFQKNFVKGMLISLGNLPLSVISSFSDVVSYVRLFAVGFAGFIVSSSFNEMALGTGIDSAVGGFIAALILLMGHGLNILLSIMSVLVHGVRLNMLEFSSHLSMEWAGKPYKPFQKS